MVYRQGNRFNLSEAKQSLIYWTCVNYKDLPDTVQHKIINMCAMYGGQYHQELFLAVTTQRGVPAIALEYKVDDSWLSRRIRKFYQNW